MPRILVAILLSPIGTLVGAWFAQYLVPGSGLDHEVTVINGVTSGTGERTPATALAFLFPTKLSIPVALATYLVVLPLAPVAAAINRRNHATWWLAATFGSLLGPAALFASVYAFPSTRSLFGGPAYPYAAVTGCIAGLWYWYLAYAPRRSAG